MPVALPVVQATFISVVVSPVPWSVLATCPVVWVSQKLLVTAASVPGINISSDPSLAR